MRFRLQPWQFLILLAIVVGALLFGIDWYRHRYVRNDGDLVSLLPAGNETVFFVDVTTLRRAGFMRLLAGAKPAEEKDYNAFVRETGLDYTKNLDQLAGAADDHQLFFVLRGGFDWDRLRQYVTAHGGSCPNGLCEIATSRPGRWASFFRIQPNVIGLAVSENHQAADALRPPGKHSRQTPENAAVWVDVSPETLSGAPEWVTGMKMFTQPLRPAESVIIALARAEGSSQSAFNVRLDAGFANEASADAARNQLQLDTKLLKLELARERRQPNPADLTGLLTSGSFQVVGRSVIGIWPVRKELLASLQ